MISKYIDNSFAGRTVFLTHYVSGVWTRSTYEIVSRQKIDNNEEPTIVLRECLWFVKAGWADVSKTTITNCWKHTGIMPEEGGTDYSDYKDYSELESLMHNIRDVQIMEKEDVMTAKKYASCDNGEFTGEEMTEQAILDFVSEEISTNEEPEEEVEKERIVYTLKEAGTGLSTALEVLKEHGANYQILKAIMNAQKFNNIQPKSLPKQTKISKIFKKRT